VGLDLPDGIPGRIGEFGGLPGILPGTRGRHGEDRATDVIVVGVEHELHDVAVAGFLIPAHQLAPDTRRAMVVEHARAHVERVIVVQDPNFGALGCGLSYLGLGLPEIGGRLRLGPDRVVEASVHRNRGTPLQGAHRGRWERVRRGGVRYCGAFVRLGLGVQCAGHRERTQGEAQMVNQPH
jgi:hypothetical protein